MTELTGIERANNILETCTTDGSFNKPLKRVKILSAGNGSLVAVMKIEKEDCNSLGTLHGGMSALIVDLMSGVAHMTHPKCTETGVSLGINMTYLNPAPLGKEIIIKATTEKTGRTIAFLNVEITLRETGVIVAKGTHIKFLGVAMSSKL